MANDGTADSGASVTPISGGAAAPTAPSGGVDTSSAGDGSEGTAASTDGDDKPWFKRVSYRKLTDAGAYEDEEFEDEDSLRARLSDDYEETLKIDKEERKFPRHHMRRLAQQGLSSTQRFEQAKRMQEEYDAKIRAAAEDPYSALDEADEYKFFGEVDGLQITKSDQIALQRAAEIFQLKQLRDSADPLHRSDYIRRERERLDRLRSAKEKIAERTRTNEQQTRDRAAFAARIEPEMVSALKAAGIPDTAQNRARIAKSMQHANTHGIPRSLVDAAHFAREEHTADIRGAFRGLSGNQALALVGPEIAKLFREAEVKAVQGAPAAAQQKPVVNSFEKNMQKTRDAATAAARGVKAISFSKPQRGA